MKQVSGRVFSEAEFSDKRAMMDHRYWSFSFEILEQHSST